jgi:hypothetical protein
VSFYCSRRTKLAWAPRSSLRNSYHGSQTPARCYRPAVQSLGHLASQCIVYILSGPLVGQSLTMAATKALLSFPKAPSRCLAAPAQFQPTPKTSRSVLPSALADNVSYEPCLADSLSSHNYNAAASSNTHYLASSSLSSTKVSLLVYH